MVSSTSMSVVIIFISGKHMCRKVIHRITYFILVLKEMLGIWDPYIEMGIISEYHPS